jgi:hypothetical protein
MAVIDIPNVAENVPMPPLPMAVGGLGPLLAGGEVGGAPPPPLGVAVPQLPCGADPGSITGWMLQESASHSANEIAIQLEKGFARLAALPDPADAGYQTELQALRDEMINGDVLGTYLVVSNTPHAAPKVTVLHSIARYSAGFGGANALHGKILGLLGETVGDQLPPVVRFIDDDQNVDFLAAITLDAIHVPPGASVKAYFNGPAALDLMPELAVVAGAVEMQLSCICPVPLAWAVYFLDFKTPIAAYQMGEALVATLPTAEQRLQADPLLDWLRASTRRLGAPVGEREISALHLDLLETTPDPRVIQWLSRKLSRFKLPLLPGPTPVGAMAPVQAAAPARTGATNEYSSLEADTVMAACGLTEAQWNTDLPSLYELMLEEGRTTVKVGSILRDLLQPRQLSLDTIVIQVTDELAKDVKNLDFGFKGDMTYASCHRGLSPFTVVAVSLEMASARQRKAERLKRATHVTLADLTDHATSPDPLPPDYAGLKELLRSYLYLLVTVVGPLCPHYAAVHAIGGELSGNMQAFQRMTARQVATVIWQIFLDSRRFFGTGIDHAGNRPVSRLAHLHNHVAAGTIPEFGNVPYQLLLTNPGPRPGNPEPPASSRGTSGAIPGGHVGTTFSRVPPPIEAVFRGHMSRFPQLTVAEVMTAQVPPVPYSHFKVGAPGACLDYLCLGQCKNASCTYKHDPSTVFSDAQVRRVVPKMQAAYTSYKSSH